ncbi:MAG: rod shape-determining protein, partial [Tissierellia bacterium]|nr:rod shape-determining protein [Tissierellia bacterium]
IISLGGIVVSDSLRVAGDDMDINIRDYIKSKYKMDIGLVTAEKIKKVLGNADEKYYSNIENVKKIKKDKENNIVDEDNEDNKDNEDNEDNEVKIEAIKFQKSMEIRGRDIVSGLPLCITVTHEEIRESILETVNNIVNAIKRVLEKTPPELAADLYTNGIYLTGGGALLKGLDIYIEEQSGLKVHIADNPLHCVVLGAGKICEDL